MPPSTPELPHRSCPICASISDSDYGFQKNGQPQDDRYLPNGYGKFTVIKDFKPNSDRKMQLLQCPECKTYYLYQTDYEYLAGGSEDEQSLDRLSDEQAAQYLEPPSANEE